MVDLVKWNKIIYKDSEGNPLLGGINGADFFDNFGIKSWPAFKDAPASHIPEKWSDDVSVFILAAQKAVPEIKFHQLKEKYCFFVVYYDCEEKNRKTIEKLKKECIDSLIEKGVHPSVNSK